MTHSNQTQTRTYLTDYQPPAWLLPQVELQFQLDYRYQAGEIVEEEAVLVTNRMELVRNPAVARAPISLDAKEIPYLVQISLDGNILNEADYTLTDSQLVIPSDAEECVVEVKTVVLPKQNSSLEGLYEASGIYCTQMEAQGFRRVTYFPDRPDVLSLFTTTVIGDRSRYPVILSNGNLVVEELLNGNLRKVVFEDPIPKPCYLFALVAGQIESIEDIYTTRTGKTVELRIYSDPKYANRLAYAMRCLKKAFAWDEEVFGFEYDLEIFNVVAVEDFNMGAMENKSLNIFNLMALVGDVRSASDERLRRIDRIIAHEYFHNYTGNRITCRSWAELTLKEGATVLRDTMYGETEYSSILTRIETVDLLRKRVFPECLGPNKHPIRPDSFVTIDNFYTPTVYEGGAEVIRMGKTILGEETFIEGMKKYFELFDGQAVCCEDFWSAMHQVSGYDFESFFRWYFQGGLLKVVVTDSYDAESREYHLTLKQDLSGIVTERNEILPFEFPLLVGILGSNGEMIAPKVLNQNSRVQGNEVMVVCSEEETTITFTDVDEPPTPSLFRGFSALLEYSYDYSDAQLLALLKYDTDAYNRRDAAQRLFSQAICSAYRALKHSAEVSVSREVSQAVALVLQDTDLEPGVKAAMLMMPALEALATSLGLVDFERLVAAKEAVVSGITAANQRDFWNCFHSSAAQLSGVSDIACDKAMQLRSLRNLCLSYLYFVEREQVESYALALVENATALSDEVPILQILCRGESSVTEQAVEIFEQRWQEIDDVFINYFSFRVAEANQHVLSLVSSLVGHEKFKAENPNYLRTLYGAFCSNAAVFHRVDGAGYQLLAELIVRLEPANPIFAARMAKIFDIYVMLDGAHRVAMRQSLEYIKAEGCVTKNVSEVVDNILSIED